ncbi:EF-P lysine aminoacylase GenX [Ectothiorhodospiraceae bacterium WFHF3C12]|nr:EF-P lysine aminoacylase GenX [Ectothiorhodospiraceae bacterium WFHF3C12]
MTLAGDWPPTAGPAALHERARMLAAIRAFFAERGVLEVETPLIGAHAVTDPHIDCVPVADPSGGAGPSMYLQSSPEYAMKRLLAAGSGAIFQVARAFRMGERGRLHNPEFSLLEWYRPGFDHHRLMDEVAELAGVVLADRPVQHLSYQAAFEKHVGLDPFSCETAAMRSVALDRLPGAPELGEDRDAWLDLLMGELVAPALGHGAMTFVYDYPASQAALARLVESNPTRAARFELFIDGWEIANGFHELGDARAQRRRFEADQARRRARGGEAPGIDERLLAALEAGLPDCAGVAVGLDRLLMLVTGASRIDEVLAFPVERS